MQTKSKIMTEKWMYVKTAKGVALTSESYHVYNQPDTDQMYETICFVTDEKHARLIAAAPDLLTALEALTNQVQRDCSMSSDPKLFELFQRHQEAIQTIRKAKGK